MAELRLAYNEVQSVLPLAGFGKLEFLELRKNRVMDVSPLQGMESLKRVYLRYNPFSLESVVALRRALPVNRILF